MSRRFGERLAETSTRELVWLGALWLVFVVGPTVAWAVYLVVR